nr:hypothetical protein [bacterium]
MSLTKKHKLVLVAVVCMLALMLQGVVGASLRVDYPGTSVKLSNVSVLSTSWKIACTSSSTTEVYGYLDYKKINTDTYITADSEYCEGGRSYSRTAHAESNDGWEIGIEPAWNSPVGYLIAYNLE